MKPDSPSSLAFHYNLDSLMHHSRIRNRDLAEVLGVCPEYVSRLRHKPVQRLNLEHVDKLLQHFNIDHNTLFTR